MPPPSYLHKPGSGRPNAAERTELTQAANERPKARIQRTVPGAAPATTGPTTKTVVVNGATSGTTAGGGSGGAAGANGQGVPAGGGAGYVLEKNTGGDYDTVWVDPTLFPILYYVATSSGGALAPTTAASQESTAATIIGSGTSGTGSGTTPATSTITWDGFSHLRLDTTAGPINVIMPNIELIPAGKGRFFGAKIIAGGYPATFTAFTGGTRTQYVRQTTTQRASATYMPGDSITFESDGYDTADLV